MIHSTYNDGYPFNGQLNYNAFERTVIGVCPDWMDEWNGSTHFI